MVDDLGIIFVRIVAQHNVLTIVKTLDLLVSNDIYPFLFPTFLLIRFAQYLLICFTLSFDLAPLL